MLLKVQLAKWYLSLAPASAPTYWREKAPLLRAHMEYDDEIKSGFLRWFPGLDLRGKDVFDIGCGYGGRSILFAQTARSVTGLEISERQVIEADQFARARGLTNTRFVVGVGEQLPFVSDSFDVITSYDVFEHVADLRKVLEECLRVLRPGGTLYAIFPPYYNPTGSHLEAWLSRMPWANLLFSKRVLVHAARELLEERGDPYRPMPLRPGDALWTLNGATVRSTRRTVRSLDCEYSMRLSALFSPLVERWGAWHMRYYAWLFGWLRFVPGLRELFAHRIVLVVRKRYAGADSSKGRTSAAA